MHLRRRLIVAGCGFGFVVLTCPALSAQIAISGSRLRIDAPAGSMKDLRDQNVVKQRFDFSCGAAALATLLRYGLGADITERQILVELFSSLPENEQAIRRRTGFSLLDLQRVAQLRGFKAEGFRLDFEQLSQLSAPVIVFIEPRGYRHFAVLRGVRGDRVYLADPSRGNIRTPAYSFRKDWLQNDGKGIIFVVEPATGLPAGKTLLPVVGNGPSLPEIMSAREMLAVGNPLVRMPEISR